MSADTDVYLAVRITRGLPAGGDEWDARTARIVDEVSEVIEKYVPDFTPDEEWDCSFTTPAMEITGYKANSYGLDLKDIRHLSIELAARWPDAVVKYTITDKYDPSSDTVVLVDGNIDDERSTTLRDVSNALDGAIDALGKAFGKTALVADVVRLWTIQ